MSESPTPHRTPQGPSVLVVDDDPVTQAELARALGGTGARVVGTGSGDAALALLAEWPAGMVVVSDAVPGGLDVARRIHASQPDVPIVLMSDEQGEKEREERAIAARLAGVFATLTKPFDRRMLAELVVALVVASEAFTSV